MVKISAVIITLNEEKNIERCLDSLVGIADEIVVVDSFSIDKTKAICLEKKVVFHENAFEGYSQQKNYANSFAKYEYILSLDADESLSPELKKTILLEKEKGFTEMLYEFNRLVFYCGEKIRHCGWYPDKKTRLWKREIGKWDDSLLHEKVQINEGIKPNFLKGDLYHHTFHTISQHIEQINKFSTLKAITEYNSDKRTNFAKILIKPFVKFFIQYFFQLGILDGFLGYIICKNSAYSEFLKLVKMQRLNKNAKI